MIINNFIQKLLIVCSLLYFVTFNSFAERSTIETQASSTIKFKATEALISFDIVGRGPDAQVSYQDYATKSLTIITYLRAESKEVSGLQTTSFKSNPVYNYQSEAKEIIGYDTISTVSFKVSSDLVAVYMNFLTKNNIDRVHDIKFSIPEDQLEIKKEEAIKDAIDKAIAKADKVLDQLGLKRKAVVKIELDTSNIRYPKFEYAIRSETARISPEPIILPKEQEIQASVKLSIAY